MIELVKVLGMSIATVYLLYVTLLTLTIIIHCLLVCLKFVIKSFKSGKSDFDLFNELNQNIYASYVTNKKVPDKMYFEWETFRRLRRALLAFRNYTGTELYFVDEIEYHSPFGVIKICKKEYQQ